MTTRLSIFVFVSICCLGFTSVVSAQPPQQSAANWHQWRGPDATGVSHTGKPPIKWSETENVKWKIPIDGNGGSSPIVWEDKVFLLTAINTGKVDPNFPKPEDQPKRVFGIKHPNTSYQFVVLCFDRNSGKELWRQTANEKVPHEGHHGDNDFASASPTTDGKRIYCWFGSAGLYCYDLDGKKIWERDLGLAHVGAALGEGCSPVVHDDKLVIVRDHSRQSMIHVLSASNGETIWEKERDEANAWATPRVLKHSGKTQVITTGSKMVRSYDLENGEVIWQTSGLTGNCIPCPVVDDNHVFCMSGYEGYSLLAIKLNSQGDVSGSDSVAWKLGQGTPYIPSPVLYQGVLYFNQSNTNIMTSVDAKTGKPVINRSRLPGISNVYASPVAANDHIYFQGRAGKTLVLRHGEKLDVVSKNELKDRFDSSPAIAGDQLFFRGQKSLYCIEAQE